MHPIPNLEEDTFPVLFGITCAKDALVVAHVGFSEGAIQQNVSFARMA